MLYLWLKSLHIGAVIVWIGGMLAATLALSVAARHGAGQASADWLRDVLRWDRIATSPAMLLAWALGLALATQGGWFPSGWLLAKLVLVLALSALHGVVSGRLRRLVHAGDDGPASAVARHAPPTVVGLALAVVILVAIKPF
ncbi:CopD family protein [Coralloluteibacterium thermophilus]|uniref:Protoporphyrinogen IX oxidase n=1 Tax=Coralloluteibacterium thermophilum TaxID=2707049 RepID=A0ABV9NHC3_9GAMM